jgi:hypothetical protein
MPAHFFLKNEKIIKEKVKIFFTASNRRAISQTKKFTPPLSFSDPVNEIYLIKHVFLLFFFVKNKKK